MRGADEQAGALFSDLRAEAVVASDRPLRAIRQLLNAALPQLSPRFEALHASGGRPSIAPEKLLRALNQPGRRSRQLPRRQLPGQ